MPGTTPTVSTAVTVETSTGNTGNNVGNDVTAAPVAMPITTVPSTQTAAEGPADQSKDAGSPVAAPIEAAGAPGEEISDLTVTGLNGQSVTYSLGSEANGASASLDTASTSTSTQEGTEAKGSGNGSYGGTAGLPGMKQETSIAVYRMGDGVTTHVADYKAEGSQAGISLIAADRSREVSIGNTADYQITYATLTVNGKKGTYNVQFNGETVVMVPLDAGAREQVVFTESRANKPIVMGGILATMNELATPLDRIKAVYIYKL